MNENENQVVEIEAMKGAYSSLKDLNQEEQARVIEWLVKKLSLLDLLGFEGLQKKNIKKEILDNLKGTEINNDIASFDSVADLFAASNANSDQEKVLLIASYLQIKNSLSEITSREINKGLQHMGHGVGNITNTISGLIDKKPQLMIQTRKEGKSQQAQKKYKVTTEGVIAAKKLINQTNGSNE